MLLLLQDIGRRPRQDEILSRLLQQILRPRQAVLHLRGFLLCPFWSASSASLMRSSSRSAAMRSLLNLALFVQLRLERLDLSVSVSTLVRRGKTAPAARVCLAADAALTARRAFGGNLRRRFRRRLPGPRLGVGGELLVGRHWRGRGARLKFTSCSAGVYELQELLNPATVLHLLEFELIALRLNRHQTLALLEEVRVRVGERLLELGHLAGAFLELPFRLVQLGAPMPTASRRPMSSSRSRSKSATRSR